MAERPSVLVTGGAGYIGSHVAWALADAGQPAVVLDDLSAGDRRAVPPSVPLVVGDVADRDLVGRVLAERRCGAVLHFAGSIVVPESVAEPLKYYRNNTCASRNLIEACLATGVRRFIFSSTAAVYGTPESVPIPETAPLRPESPYGTSKLATEWMLRDAAAAWPEFRYVALRYFNVAGADPALRTGQRGRSATHLLKIACETATGKRPFMETYGADYATPDGTCIRDFIHVSDLAAAHLAALDHLAAGGGPAVLNCGYGRGFSVREVVAAVKRVAGTDFEVRPAPRRPGDPARLVADPGRLKTLLGWTPRHDDIEHIVGTALAWERKIAAEG
jgi:UDP-glucose 4-epimerase